MADSIPQNSPHVAPRLGGLTEKVSWYARQKMFSILMKTLPIAPETKILDVGVTCDRSQDCNFFEKLYPYPENITAVGIEDASFLEKEFPGVTFVQTDGVTLPFADKSFDLVLSFAVINCVGRYSQKQFLEELCRVGHTCVITTPNPWYPIEFHTALPFVHWLPQPWFRQVLKWLGQDFLAREENLYILTEKEILQMLPAGVKAHKRNFWLFGLVSNLIFYFQ